MATKHTTEPNRIAYGYKNDKLLCIFKLGHTKCAFHEVNNDTSCIESDREDGI